MDEGAIIIDGKDVTGHAGVSSARAVIGRVFQDPMMGTAPNMQIEENLALAIPPGQAPRPALGHSPQRAGNCIRSGWPRWAWGWKTGMTAKVGLLSGGQRQALTLLMAALQKPKLLLLDEHTAALDPATAAKVLELTDQIDPGKPPDRPDDYPQHDRRHPPRQPADYDERRADRAGHLR